MLPNVHCSLIYNSQDMVKIINEISEIMVFFVCLTSFT